MVILTLAQRSEFAERGILFCPQLVGSEKATQAVDAVRQRLTDEGLWHGNAWQLSQLTDCSLSASAKLGKRIKGCPELDDLVQDEIPSVVEQLLDGQDTFCGMDVPQPLFTLPNADSWSVPNSNWHMDVARFANRGIPGVQMFTFLEAVEPTGGATVVVAGSHRLLNDENMSSKDVKQRLIRESYFQDLTSKQTMERERFLREVGKCDGVDVQVVELCGEPGDVYFTDLRVVHAWAPNALKIPRIMLTRRYFLESFRDLIFGQATE